MYKTPMNIFQRGDMSVIHTVINQATKTVVSAFSLMFLIMNSNILTTISACLIKKRKESNNTPKSFVFVTLKK